MGTSAENIGPQVAKFRDYLCLLARAHSCAGGPSRIEASDVVQQTLLEAHEQRGRFRGTSDAEMADWLKQMLAHNMADSIRRLRCAKRDVRRERPLKAAIEDSFSRAQDWLAAEQTSPSGQVMRIEQSLKLARELARLPDDQRDAVVLHHLQGRSLAQLAAHLERSESAVAGLLHRGLKRLRELMDGEEVRP